MGRGSLVSDNGAGGAPVRRSPALWLLLSAVVLGFAWYRLRPQRTAEPAADATTIEKRAVQIETHTFDPEAPPPEMPPLRPGEQAECESTFVSNASVIGDSRKTDATHAVVTVRRVKMTLELRIAIWVPRDAAQHVIEHEEGHRQISERYYQVADRVAARIAAGYIGRHLFLAGSDPGAEIGRQLQETGREITVEYSQALNPDPAQLRYDEITDHSRNDLDAEEAVAQALRETTGPAGP